MNCWLKNIFIFSVLFLCFFFSFCRQPTAKDQIKELIKKIGAYVEQKDTARIMMYVAADYSDFEFRDKGKTKAMLEQYFRQYKGIVIHFLSTRVKIIGPSQAEVQTEIALSSGAAKIFRRLVKISIDNYRLKMKLIKKNDKWLIQYAEWRYVSLDQLFPESLKILEKIFGAKFSDPPKD
ncbi:MAG: hypothetical protein ACE5GI_00905 [Candidatus Aminicenantales bacterium]